MLRSRIFGEESIELPFGVDDLGWSGEDLDTLIGSLPEDAAQDESTADSALGAQEDIIPTVPPDPVSSYGDVIKLGRHTLHCTNCMELLRSMPADSVDAIVTDPPYGLSPDGRARTWDEIAELRAQGKGPKRGFMGKEGDAGVPGITWARECLRVLKPGGHIIAFASTRTIHRLTVSLEDAGFQIRDQIGWLYWNGFPKSMDISNALDVKNGVKRPGRNIADAGNNKILSPSRSVVSKGSPQSDAAMQWDGWGTSVKPAQEPAVLGRKPLEKGLTTAENVLKWRTGGLNIDAARIPFGDPRWPGPDRDQAPIERMLNRYPVEGQVNSDLGRWPANIIAVPKASTGEREEGCDDLQRSPTEVTGRELGSRGQNNPRAGMSGSRPRGNHHPTVKPVKLMRWLLQLITPPGGTVLEPFAGSGSTLVAAHGLDLSIVAAELEPAYCDIVVARISALSKERP